VKTAISDQSIKQTDLFIYIPNFI